MYWDIRSMYLWGMAISTFISEAIIEKQLGVLEDEVFGQRMMQDFLENEPILASFLFSEDIKILEETEKSLFSYIIVAIWSASAEAYESARCTPEKIESLEEKNWEEFTSAKGDFRTKLDGFFEAFPQEDLLAFVEDLLQGEAEGEAEVALSKEGKEFILIKIKTLLDAMILPAA